MSCLLLLVILNSCTKTVEKPKKDFATIYNSSVSDSINKLLQPLTDNSFKANDSGMIAITVLLKENNTTLIDRSYFFSNANMPLPNDSTLFQLGSVTKTFTAALIAKQVNSGRMLLNDSAQNYLPKDTPLLPTSFNGQNTIITLGELTAMNSGLTRNAPTNHSTHNTPYPFAFSYLTNKAKLLYKPGSSCNIYSNLGYGIVGLAISHLSYPNKKEYYNYYEQVAIDSLLTPLKMDDTRITLTPSQLKRRAIPYAINGTISSYNNPNWPFNLAAGGLYSTITDMQKYAKSMIGESSFLTTKDIDTLLFTRGKVWADTCEIRKDFYKAKQAMAWVTNRDMKTPQGIGFNRHSKDGGLAGFSTYITFATPIINGTSYKAYVVTLANRNKLPVQNNSVSILQLLFDTLAERDND
jgi:CubicO group peptidase (beta-lactamase class C family)